MIRLTRWRGPQRGVGVLEDHLHPERVVRALARAHLRHPASAKRDLAAGRLVDSGDDAAPASTCRSRTRRPARPPRRFRSTGRRRRRRAPLPRAGPRRVRRAARATKVQALHEVPGDTVQAHQRGRHGPLPGWWQATMRPAPSERAAGFSTQRRATRFHQVQAPDEVPGDTVQAHQRGRHGPLPGWWQATMRPAPTERAAGSSTQRSDARVQRARKPAAGLDVRSADGIMPGIWASSAPAALWLGIEPIRPRVYGCSGASQHVVHAALLDDAPGIHHRHAIGEPGHHRQNRG